MRLYSVYEEWERIYREYLRLLSGATDIDPEDFEVDFLVKAIQSVSALGKDGKTYTAAKPLDGLRFDLELIEVLNIIGLNGHRYLNRPMQDIELSTNDYRSGLLRYRHNPPATEDMNYLNDFRCLIRVVIKAHHPEVLRFTAETTPESPEPKRGCHLLVFENWMGNSSEELAMRAQSDVEFLGLSTLRFWRLTDVDGFFNGNSYYRPASNLELVN